MKNTFFILYFLGSLIIGLTQNIEAKKDSLYNNLKMEMYENPEKAISQVLDLIKYEKKPEEKAQLYLILSNMYISIRNFDESLKYVLKAKEYLKGTKNIESRVNTLISIATIYEQMGIYNKCFETLNEADETLKQWESDKKYSYVAKSYALRGMIYKTQNNYEIALEKLLLANKNIDKSLSQKPKFANKSVILYNIAYCYFHLNNNAQAIYYFEQSNKYAQKAEGKSIQAFALKGLSETYTQMGQNQKALDLLKTAEELSENIGDLTLNEGIYELMADNYILFNDLEKYRLYRKKYVNNRKQREQKELNSINRSIENQTSERQNTLAQIEKHYQRITIVLIGVFILILGVLIYFIVKIKKTNKAIYKRY